MAANFSLASANITGTDAEGNPLEARAKVQINVRHNRAVLTSDRGAHLVTREGVLTTTRRSNIAWTVTFADGEVWDVQRDRSGCRRCG